MNTMSRDDDIREYFLQYARVSFGSEPEKLAEFYDDSFLAAGPKGGAAFRNDAAFLDWLRQIHEFNAQTGMTSMAPEAVEQIAVSADYTLATVRWAATFRKLGDEPVRFSISYLLRDSGSRYLVAAYVSHEDQEDAMRAHGLL
jgi:hypothetical protein